MKRIVLIFAVLVLSLTGCSRKIIEKVVYQHDTTFVNRRDSLYFRDSIYVKEYVKGDTVYIEKFKDRYVYKDRWRDSIVTKVDSVAVERIKEVKVDKPLSFWQRLKIGSFWWLLIGLAGCLAWIFRKPILALIRKFI